ncbi:MAG: glycosyltransferase family A protein [Candidatus Caldarchaeales archaeon]|jgi:glycosyltransferase involved in cell wall biosynthesis
MKASVIIPSKGCTYIKHPLLALRDQTLRPHETVLVVKGCDIKEVKDLCRKAGLSCIVIEQRHGFFTHALNLGKKNATGDLMFFTDDDAIPPPKWIEKYVKLHLTHPRTAGIASRDIYLDLQKRMLLPIPDDKLPTKLYRWAVRPWLERPHPLLKKYRLGVYLTKNLDIAHGPYIPDRECFSLLFRGVNMSFKASDVYDVWFPEHPLLKRAFGNEQHFALQLLLKGLETIYVPNNPVLHIARGESLSRTRNKKELRLEIEVMKSLYKQLLAKST